jgi:hypothetical protein
VEKGALVEREEPKPSDAVKTKKEIPVLVEAPGFRAEEAKASPKQEIPLEVLGNETPMAEALRDEVPKDEGSKAPPKQNQRRLDQLQAGTAKKDTLRKSKRDRFLHLSFESAKILFLVGTAGYLLWSVSSHFFLKKPEARVPMFKENGTLVAATASTGNSPAADNPSSETRAPQPSPKPSPQISSAAPAGEVDTFEDVRDTLEKIKQGNLTKNIELFMACYSPSFKDREEKRKETLRTWGSYNYYDLSYDLKACTFSGGIARAKVEWRVLFAPKAGGPAEESRSLLNVTLEKKEDGWKILEVKSLS